MRKGLILICIISCLVSAGQDESLEQYIVRKAKKINSGGPDKSTLRFLDTLLQGRRFVLLGESSHGTEEYSETKLQLIRYLHENLGFNVLLLESPMMASAYVNVARDSASPSRLLQNSIQSFWHTKAVEKLFDYLKSTNIKFNGFDPQFIKSPFSSLLITHALSNYPKIKQSLLQIENRITEAFKNRGKYLDLKNSFSIDYTTTSAELAKHDLSPLQQWLLQMLTTYAGYYLRINKGDQRDSCMAKNIVWLAENLYPREKIIIWAHNIHIDKNATSANRLMGKLLYNYFREQLYSIGFYMTQGETALNNREVVTIKTPPKGSLEEVLGSLGYKAAFLETQDPLFNRKILTLHWGKDKQQINLYKSYDAVILLREVRAPEYLP